jgi:epoxyqueuosine reductase
MMTAQLLTANIRSKALEIGFDKVGFTKAERVKSASLLEAWLKSGFHGTMRWMEKYLQKRVDPCELFPGARSVVAVALNYHAPEEINDDKNRGKISRYAWGDDYHNVMKDKLHRLLDYVQLLNPDIRGKCCVDTSPMMDKYWAAQAGIGWQGKHSNIITRELGSWVFLGEIILNIELEYGVPIRDFCGTCDRCMEACPTDAITQPYVVDSNKCISYVTIEYRGEKIPDTVDVDNWIYGCDICQDVCPWNEKFAKTTLLHEFYPRENNLNPKLSDLEKTSEEDFRKRFKNSAVKRAKYAGFMRNVKHVLSKWTE